VDESYVLTIPADGSMASLKAVTVYGAIRGLESFSQLVQFVFADHAYELAGAPWEIQDFPRFSHRGVLMDTSRHYEPIPVLKQLVDSLAYAKFNVLHWHVVDHQSFPFESVTYPALWEGAYSNDERYTTADMAELVEHARLRGVRVVAEFDVPGHASSWCVGYPEICPSTSCLSPLDPSSPETWQVLAGLLNDVTGGSQYAGLFPDDFVHMGGDEVDTSCWTSTPHVMAWLSAHNFTTDDAYMYFVETAHQDLIAAGRSPVNWEEVFNHFGTKLDKQTIVHIWLDHKTLKTVVDAGYRGILSDGIWYLDHLDVKWDQLYLNDPHTGIDDPASQKRVLGGEVCMWSETVDPSDLFNTIWPRAAAAAERLWSARNVTDTTRALPRLETFRCILTRRGIGAAPVQNANARTAPPEPGSCFNQ